MHVNRRVLLLLATLPAACARLEATDLADHEQSIVNGTPIDDAEVKAVVFLQGPGGPCTGTFIHPYYILTAAHCLPKCATASSFGCWTSHDGTGLDIADGDGWAGYSGAVTMTAHDGLNAGDGNGYAIDHVQFATHADFIASPYAPDMAVLRTTTPFRGQIIPVMSWSEHPSPDNLCDDHEGAVPTMMGYSTNNGTTSATRRQGVAEVECDIEANNRAFKLDGHGRDFVGSRTCGGDSGGPVLWRNHAGRLTTGGILSYGDDYDVLTNTRCPSPRGETGAAFIARTALERVASTDGRCAGRSWDACVAALRSAPAPTAPKNLSYEVTPGGIKLTWVDEYPAGTDRLRIARSPGFREGRREYPTSTGARYVWDLFGAETSPGTRYTYWVCAVNTLEEEACAMVVYTTPIATPPSGVTASGLDMGTMRLQFSTIADARMQPLVRVYRNGVSGFRTFPLGRAVDFTDTESVYGYTVYTYRVCTVSTVGTEACASATTDTYAGTPMCPRGTILCEGACRPRPQCDLWQ